MQPERRDAVRGLTATTIAGSFALAAFAVAIVAGLASGNAASSILLRALIAMVVCYPVGLGVGLVAQRIVSDHLDANERANPLPEFPDGEDDEPLAHAVPEPEASEEEEVLVV